MSEHPGTPPLEPVPAAKMPPAEVAEASSRPLFPIVLGVMFVATLAYASFAQSGAGKSDTPAATAAPAPAPAPEAVPAVPTTTPAVEAAKAEPAAPATAPAPAGTEDVKALKAEVEALTKRLDEVNEKLAAMPRAEPAPDLKPLVAKVDDLGKLPETIAPLSKGLADLEGRVGATDKSIEALKGEIAALQAKTPAEAPTPAVDVNAALAVGTDLYKAGKYAQALDEFRKLEESAPQDARVWYYAALANGFATQKWVGETETLVNKGIEREKAGTPPAAEIDASFAGLTAATGKDWLASYRARAKK